MSKNPMAFKFGGASASSTALAHGQTDATPLRRNAAAGLIGDLASQAVLNALADAVRDMKAANVAPLLRTALAKLNSGDFPGCGEYATKALEVDERSGLAWRLLAISREKAGDFSSAVKCFESALKLSPDHTEIANDLGRLAYRLDMKDVAAKLFAHFCTAHPELPDGANNLACVLRDQNQYEAAIEVLKPAISAHPTNPLLWNTLGSILTEQGDPATAMTFFNEALTHDPAFAKARYNRGNTLLALGDLDGALADVETASKQTTAPDELAMMRLARSTSLLCMGRIGEGWDDYEARIDPDFAATTHFMIDRPRWSPDQSLTGKHLLVMGEQGLGDEVMFANTLPDVIEALGPDGTLSIAVEPRLIPLFQRSFPNANVGAHATYRINMQLVRGAPYIDDMAAVDLWTPLASLLRGFRRTEDAFPKTTGFLKPDPKRIAYWRETLVEAGDGPKIGLLWKSMSMTGARHLSFSAFEQWEAVLTTPGLCFVNLQYGDCAAELALAKARFGVDIWTPPGIDLKQDLDDLAALSCAMDMIAGFANATSSIAAACGAPVSMMSNPAAWSQCGTGRYPWAPQVKVYNRALGGGWDEVMTRLAGDLAEIA